MKSDPKNLQNHTRVPEDGVCVVAVGRVEPRPELLLPVSDTSDKNVCVDGVRLARHVPKELEVDLVVLVPSRRRLRQHIFDKSFTYASPFLSIIE